MSKGKSLGDIVKEQHGIEVENPNFDKEAEARTAKYWKEIKEKKEVEYILPTAEVIYSYLGMFAPSDFKIDDTNREFIKQLCYYFAQDPEFLNYPANNEKDLNKGLLIIGDCGLGKSYVLNTIYRMFQKIKGYSFGFVSAITIVEGFNSLGDEGLIKYKEQVWCIDDIGTEDVGSHYGKNDVLKMLLEVRYNKFVYEDVKTHGSTNLLPQQLKDRYGERVYSRIQQMFNIIILEGKDRRK